MENALNLEKFIPRTKRAFAFGAAVALGVLAATIVSGLFFVRGMVRAQIVQRDAEALHATTLMEQLDDARPDGTDIRTDEQIGFDSALRASRLKGVIGIRFYDADGVFADAFPATILPLPMTPKVLESVHDLEPHGRLLPKTSLSTVFIYLPQFASGPIARVPILEVTVPLHRRDTKTLAGAAQFIIEGASISDEYARLDRRLVLTAATTFIGAGLLLLAMLWPAFRHLEKLNRDLALREERLQRANEELALAARASAVGSISAHLMHGLKNPLASLSHFVSQDGSDTGNRQDALTAARRMQSLVERTLEVLGDARGEPTYELTVPELNDDVKKRVAAAAERRRVVLSVRAEGQCMLSSRTANLASLILTNLLENAIEATPPGGAVSLAANREGDRLNFRVRDGGPGFPEHLRAHLFLPCKSTREGGSGIGLAISKQIAEHLGARLELEESSPDGCVWLLNLPLTVCQES